MCDSPEGMKSLLVWLFSVPIVAAPAALQHQSGNGDQTKTITETSRRLHNKISHIYASLELSFLTAMSPLQTSSRPLSRAEWDSAERKICWPKIESAPLTVSSLRRDRDHGTDFARMQREVQSNSRGSM
jgi:hypothetical protein